MKLDSFAYRYLWKLKQLVGIHPGPRPIIWKKSEYKLCPPADFVNQLNEKQKENLQKFQRELEIVSQFYTYLPSQFTQKQWKELVQMDSPKERFDLLRFAKIVEKRKEADRRQKMGSVQVTRPDEDQEIVENFSLYKFFYPEFLKEQMRNIRTMRMAQAVCFNDRPNIVVDCRFLQEHTKRGRGLTFLQLNLLLSMNKKRLHPWPIVFANFDETNKIVSEGLDLYLSQIKVDSQFIGDYTPKSYLDLYEPERLIYLSPHAEDNLTTDDVMDERNVFIIGGIVDRIKEPNIHPHASFVCAEEEGIRCRKLPLDDYMEWKAGNKLLTLTAVIQIIQNVFDTRGDWRSALERTIPIRNKITMAEKNPNIKKRNAENRLYQSEVFRILRENLPN